MVISTEIEAIKSHWLEYLKTNKNYSINTIEAYNYDITYFFTFINNYLEKIVNIDVVENHVNIRLLRSMMASRLNDEKKYHINSNKRLISVIRSFYKFLDKKYEIENTDVFLLKNPKTRYKVTKSLSLKEVSSSVENILNINYNAKNHLDWIDQRNKALILLIYASGVRISEALSITKKHMKNKEYLKIKGKGDKERIIPWIKEVREFILRYMDKLPKPLLEDDFIFRGKSLKQLSRSVFHKELVKLRNLYNLPKYLSAHSFRHSFASNLLQEGANLRVIQELLGHVSLSSTQHYTSINSHELEKAYDKFHPSNFFAENTKK